VPLTAGTRLGPYEVVSALGAGGMGEVYKAHDTRLQRTVAVKVLPPHVLAEPGARARFEREARAISGLDHPNICVVHDVGREGDLEYIVMQYLDGETLADRLARGPLLLPDALRFGAEIASALDRAHRAGFLHRDVKPGNIMIVKAAGRSSARLLDFGLAKAAVAAATAEDGRIAATVTSPLTGRGTIVGTLVYMSPEQLEGREVDGRSDIFSFGAVLYEMVTGRRAFDGASQASIIAAILERDPPPMSSVVPIAPPALDRVVRKCLHKDPERRWQSAADLCDELGWIEQAPGQLGAAAPPSNAVVTRPQRVGTALLGAAAVLLTIALGAVLASPWVRRAESPAPTSRHLSIDLPGALNFARGGLAISPDGRTVAFVASDAAAKAGLYLRRFDSSEVVPIPGTDGARTPFFSPDGQSLGYFTSRALWKVSLRGGDPVRVGGTPPVTRGGVWMPDNSIIVAPTQTSGLIRFSPDGQPAPLTTPDEKSGAKAHLWPERLPDGALLCVVRRGTTTDADAADIAVLDIATGTTRVLVQGGSFPRYSPTGHLLFVRAGTVNAVPFDPVSKQVRGAPVPIATGVAVDVAIGGAHYAIASDGALLVLRGEFPFDRLSPVWVDRAGVLTPAAGIAGRAPSQPRLSRDGRQALFDTPSADGDDEVYVADLERGTAMRLSLDPRDDFNAIWTPDNRHVIWAALQPARLPFLVMRAADGSSATEEILSDPQQAMFPGSVSNARILAFTRATSQGSVDIWTGPLDGARRATPFIETPAFEYGPEFSPDGKWIAYVSEESGARQVYVAPYPGPGAGRRVTANGGVSPGWSRDGSELFYQTVDGFIAVTVRPGDSLDFGAPRKLFGPVVTTDSREDGARAWDVSPDGKRFLMMKAERTAPPPPSLHVLLGWVAGINAGKP